MQDLWVGNPKVGYSTQDPTVAKPDLKGHRKYNDRRWAITMEIKQVNRLVPLKN